jgi:putative DNA primase/helicase
MVFTANDYIETSEGWLRKDHLTKPDNHRNVTNEDNSLVKLTDMGNAERLVKMFGKDLRYCYETGCWLVWNGKVWENDTGEKVMACAKATVRNMYVEASNINNDHQRLELAEHAKRSESESKLHAMIDLSKDLVPIHIKDLDADKMLFNCQNGTIDLTKGILHPHRKEDYITLISPVEYNLNCHSELWQKHLIRVTGNNQGLITYLQRVFGYCLTGETKEQVMFFIHGQTKTGKSKTVGAVMWVLGDYAKQTPSETLLVQRNGGHSDKARLASARMVVAIENERGEKLASASIKNMTGEDRITARFLYKENFEFYPTFKLFLVANDKPSIRGEDSAMWERLKLIPFNQYIPLPERDKDLETKLRKEGSGILTWMMKGCLDWQRDNDLLEPGEVTTQTSIYRSEMDIIGDFIDDCCTVGKSEKVPHNDLYESYGQWCIQNDEEPISKRAFTLELQSRSFIAKRTSSNKVWHGLSLKDTPESVTCVT